jgi:DNA-binding transcriptional ArsR family regulator
MKENSYRQCRICRLLGNPVVYQLRVLLDSQDPLTASRLAMLTGRTVSTLSIHLAKLRVADLVRYDTTGKETLYRLKHRARTQGLLKYLARLVGASSRLT